MGVNEARRIWSRENHAKAMAELRKDAKPTLDAKAFEIVKTDVRRLYGFEWPEGADLVDGTKALFDFLIRKSRKP